MGHSLKIRKRKKESLRDYVQHFQPEAIQVPNLIKETRLLVAMQGQKWDSRFFVEVNTNPPRNMEDFLARVVWFIHVEDIVKPGKGKINEAKNSYPCQQDSRRTGWR